VHEVFISDTTEVGCSLWPNGDTNYYFLDKLRNGHWIAYFDRNKKQKAIESDFIEGKDEEVKETKWYSTGQIKYEFIDYRDFIYDLTFWYPDGRIEHQRKCHNDTCTFEYYNLNGNLDRRFVETLDNNDKNKIITLSETRYYYDTSNKLKRTEEWRDRKIVNISEK
jgi:hypothetical protein